MKIRMAKKILKTPWPLRVMVYNRQQIWRATLALTRYEIRSPAYRKALQRAKDKVRELVAAAKAKLANADKGGI